MTELTTPCTWPTQRRGVLSRVVHVGHICPTYYLPTWQQHHPPPRTPHAARVLVNLSYRTGGFVGNGEREAGAKKYVTRSRKGGGEVNVGCSTLSYLGYKIWRCVILANLLTVEVQLEMGDRSGGEKEKKHLVDLGLFQFGFGCAGGGEQP